MAGNIDFYFDFLSPYGYLAATQIDALAEKYDRAVTWRPFLLGVTVIKVMGLKPLLETPLKSDYVLHDVPRLAQLYGVSFVRPARGQPNPLAASRAYYWIRARDAKVARAVASALLCKQWAEGGDISEPQVVAGVAEKFGVDAGALLRAIASAAAKEALEREVQEAIDRGVFGSPYFIVDGEAIWGADRLWMLEYWLKYGSWQRRAGGGCSGPLVNELEGACLGDGLRPAARSQL